MTPDQADVDVERDARILATVQQAKRLSRADLARHTGLSRAVLDARLKALQRRGLLAEAGPGASTGGRRPQLVVFQENAGYIVAVELGLTSVDVAVTDLTAGIRAHVARPAEASDGPDVVLPLIEHLIEEALGQAGVDPRQVKGMGIGMPGPVESTTGLPLSPSDMPGWQHFPLRDHFTARFDWPVCVDNDANVLALGERWAGLGRAVDDFLWVKLGTGIGCGIVCGGRIYRGADNCSGDIGHIGVPGEDVRCPCGNTGCLGWVAGGHALARQMEQAAHAGESPYLARLLAHQGALTAVDLVEALGQGDPFAAQLVRRTGATIGQVLAVLVNFYNPRLIVVGGGLAHLGDLLLAALREAIYGRSTPLATRHLAIQRSALGDEAGVVGAAALVLDHLFRAPQHLSSRSPRATKRALAGRARHDTTA